MCIQFWNSMQLLLNQACQKLHENTWKWYITVFITVFFKSTNEAGSVCGRFSESRHLLKLFMLITTMTLGFTEFFLKQFLYYSSNLIPQRYLAIIPARRPRGDQHLQVTQYQHLGGFVRFGVAFLQVHTQKPHQNRSKVISWHSVTNVLDSQSCNDTVRVDESEEQWPRGLKICASACRAQRCQFWLWGVAWEPMLGEGSCAILTDTLHQNSNLRELSFSSYFLRFYGLSLRLSQHMTKRCDFRFL